MRLVQYREFGYVTRKNAGRPGVEPKPPYLSDLIGFCTAGLRTEPLHEGMG
jgi:hypothetical protein